MAFCRGFDLVIDSHWPVSGAMHLAGQEPGVDGRADLQIRDVSPGLRGMESGPGHRSRADSTALFEFGLHGIGRFVCDAGQHLDVFPDPNASRADILGSLIASAIPAALWMRGDLVLHAAAVQVPGAARAIAIAGPSQSGKSTILEQLIDLGWQVIGDDALRVRSASDQFEISGLPAAYFQRAAAPRPEKDAKRAMVGVPEPLQLPRGCLGALLILDHDRSGNPPVFQRLSGAPALEALLKNLHRYWIPRHLRMEARILPMLTQLLDRIPVYFWHRKDGAHALSRQELDFLGGVLTTDRTTVQKYNKGISCRI